MELLKRYRGAFLGMAAGDALGTTVEFRARGSFKPLTDIVGGGVFNLNKGDWTDDTSMGLCLAESLLKRKGFDAVHQMDTYVEWWAHGHNSSRPDKGAFDIGSTVRSALRLWKTRKEMYNDGNADPFCGSTEALSSGNGCIMRMAPIPLFFHEKGLNEVMDKAGDSARTTHGSKASVDTTRAMAAVIYFCLQGWDKEKISEQLSKMFESDLHPDLQLVLEWPGTYRAKGDRFIYGTGYVVQSFEAAMWAWWNSTNFEDGALMAVNLGDDADTTGAVYGQIAGAYYGEDSIPAHWRKCLTRYDLLSKTADRLYKERLKNE